MRWVRSRSIATTSSKTARIPALLIHITETERTSGLQRCSALPDVLPGVLTIPRSIYLRAVPSTTEPIFSSYFASSHNRLNDICGVDVSEPDEMYRHLLRVNFGGVFRIQGKDEGSGPG